jgi:hypothetical protein
VRRVHEIFARRGFYARPGLFPGRLIRRAIVFRDQVVVAEDGLVAVLLGEELGVQRPEGVKDGPALSKREIEKRKKVDELARRMLKKKKKKKRCEEKSDVRPDYPAACRTLGSRNPRTPSGASSTPAPAGDGKTPLD